jgi:hypothetical protein
LSARRGSYTQYPARRRRRASRKPAAIALVAILLVAGGALLAVRLTWPASAVETDPAALAGVRIASIGEQVERVSVRDAQGRPVPVRLRSNRIWPVSKLPSGERLEIRATVHRASWVSWLVGSTKQVALTVVTPKTDVRATLLHLAPGAPVVLRFHQPASHVLLTLPGFDQQELVFAKPHAALATGVRALGPNRYGVLTVATAARSWEELSPPVKVSWFPKGDRLQALVRPSPGGVIQPSTPIELTFSEPVSSVLGRVRPTLDPPVPGKWAQTADNALTFVPGRSGFPLGRHVTVQLPAPTDILSAGKTQTVESLTWSVPVGSTLRLHQILSELGYLPLSWAPAQGDVAPTALAQKQAALHAPSGTFNWRYSDTPAQLKSLWRPILWTRMTQGAVMAFQSDHGLDVDGIPGPATWHTLIRAAIAGEKAHSYSYVLVHRSVPQTLTLWNDGRTILTARINTGVPAAPTPLGTHAVFEHIPVGTMRGQNPDGSHYVDPGIKWISYFNGGEAIHGFNRATYGFPQSVGCVEAPDDTAGKIWPYTPIGTLVTIVP